MAPESLAGDISFALFFLWKKPLFLGTCPFLFSASRSSPGTWRVSRINFRRCVNSGPGSLERSVFQPKLSIGHSAFPGAGISGQELSCFCSALTAGGPGRAEGCWLQESGKGLRTQRDPSVASMGGALSPGFRNNLWYRFLEAEGPGGNDHMPERAIRCLGVTAKFPGKVEGQVPGA